MSEVKLPYYPQVQATMSASPFGVPEISCPTIYDTPLSNKFILRIDLLAPLTRLMGDECMRNRAKLYELVSGNTVEPRKLLKSYYSKFPMFREFVNDEFYFGDTSKDIYDRILAHMQRTINDCANETQDACILTGGKYLVMTHDFLYYAYKSRHAIPKVVGGTVIC